MPEGYYVDSPQRFDYMVEQLRAKGFPFYIEVQTSRISGPQFNALHVWCHDTAIVLNDAGFDKRVVFAAMREGVQLPWHKDSVKEDLWKPVQYAVNGEKSTTRQSTKDPDKVLNVLCRWIGEKFGVVLPPWPSRFNRGAA